MVYLKFKPAWTDSKTVVETVPVGDDDSDAETIADSDAESNSEADGAEAAEDTEVIAETISEPTAETNEGSVGVAEAVEAAGVTETTVAVMVCSLIHMRA